MKKFKFMSLAIFFICGYSRLHGMTALRTFFKPLIAKMVSKSITKGMLGTAAIGAALANAFTQEGGILTSRPQKVQKAVDKAFEQNKAANRYSWRYNGSRESYGLMNIDDEKLLKSMVSTSGANDIYIIDVGCAQAGWGRYAMSILENQTAGQESHIHIFSLTGGSECEESIEQKGNITLHQFNLCKIENIDTELQKRGFDLKDKVGLIVSRWTLRHLVDPFGTLDRLYSLLSPNRGVILSNGFLFGLEGSEEVHAFPIGSEYVLRNSKATSLFRLWDSGRDAGQFMLMRNEENNLDISLNYTGEMRYIRDSYQNDSNTLTIFKTSVSDEVVPNREHIPGTDFYCNGGDQKCKNLYNTLKAQGLFYEPK